MHRTIVIAISVVAVIVSSVGAYVLLARSDAMADTQAAALPPDPNQQPREPARTRPNHGDFQNRFEPRTPPPDGGRQN